MVLIAWGAFRYAWLAAPEELTTDGYMEEVSEQMIATIDSVATISPSARPGDAS